MKVVDVGTVRVIDRAKERDQKIRRPLFRVFTRGKRKGHPNDSLGNEKRTAFSMEKRLNFTT